MFKCNVNLNKSLDLSEFKKLEMKALGQKSRLRFISNNPSSYLFESIKIDY
jgi:hypothetical protein